MACLVAGPMAAIFRWARCFLLTSEHSHTLPKSFDSVDAGQDQPVVAGEISQRPVQRLVRPRLADFDKRDIQHFRAEIRSPDDSALA